jgi:hypothetical protein
LAIKTNATLSELYTTEDDFNFNVDITHKETFPKLFFQLNLLVGSNLIEKSVSLYNRRQEIKNNIS